MERRSQSTSTAIGHDPKHMKKKNTQLSISLEAIQISKQDHKSLGISEPYKEEKNLCEWKYNFRNEILILGFHLA